MHSPTYYDSKLCALSNDKIARKRQKEIRGIKGVRGVSNSDLIEVINEEDWPVLPEDSEDLHQLFGRAHEDGLLAIALLSVAALKSPNEALELAEGWLPFLDDTETADSLGHLVIGPCAIVLGESLPQRIISRENVFARRAELMASLAAFPVPIQGVCAAALRRHLEVDELSFVAEPLLDLIQDVVKVMMREEHPILQKGLRRIITIWAGFDPDHCRAFFELYYPNWPNWMKSAHQKGAKVHLKKGK